MSITDDLINHIARAMAKDDGDDWHKIDVETQEWWLRLARVADMARTDWERQWESKRRKEQ